MIRERLTVDVRGNDRDDCLARGDEVARAYYGHGTVVRRHIGSARAVYGRGFPFELTLTYFRVDPDDPDQRRTDDDDQDDQDDQDAIIEDTDEPPHRAGVRYDAV